MLALDAVEQLQPVELASLQRDTEEQQVRPPRCDRVERPVAVARGARLVAFVLQNARHQFADGRLVVDDENVRRHGYRSFAGSRTCDFSASSAAPTVSAAKRSRTHAPRPPDATSGASNSSIFPPCSSRMRPTIARPRPVPFSRVVT